MAILHLAGLAPLGRLRRSRKLPPAAQLFRAAGKETLAGPRSLGYYLGS
jgi:hypothetical protein